MVIFEELFRKANWPEKLIYKDKEIIAADKISLKDYKVTIKINFISTKSEYKQLIMMSVNKKGYFFIDGENVSNKIAFSEDEWKNEKDITMEVITKDKLLWVYNGWIDVDYRGVEYIDYWHNGAAMYVEEIPNGRKYYCNDGEPDDDFDDLIFTLEFMD
jgi:hypothetical protein